MYDTLILNVMGSKIKFYYVVSRRTLNPYLIQPSPPPRAHIDIQWDHCTMMDIFVFNKNNYTDQLSRMKFLCFIVGNWNWLKLLNTAGNLIARVWNLIDPKYMYWGFYLFSQPLGNDFSLVFSAVCPAFLANKVIVNLIEPADSHWSWPCQDGQETRELNGPAMGQPSVKDNRSFSLFLSQL